jgi:hypothetical protein
MTATEKLILDNLNKRIQLLSSMPTNDKGNEYWIKQALKHLRSAKTNFEKAVNILDKFPSRATAAVQVTGQDTSCDCVENDYDQACCGTKFESGSYNTR